MKKIFLFATFIVAAFNMVSCDIDDVENYGEMSSENFPATEEDGMAVLAGVYQNLNYCMANPQNSLFLYNAMLASDDMLGGGGDNDKLMQALDLLVNNGDDMLNSLYTKRYEGINRANSLIYALPSTGLDDNLKNQFLGEAKFLRAFYYYDLASTFGNVPVRVIPGGEEIKQGDITDPWKQILQDLRDACELLPNEKTKDNQAGRVDKYAAEAMLGRAWLFYAGMFCNGTLVSDMTSTTYNPLTSCELPDGTTLTEANVIAYIDDCVNNSGYSLVPDFRNLWAYTNRCTVEDYEWTKGQGLKWVEDDGAINPESMFAIKFNKFASWSTTIGYANGLSLHFGVRGGQDIDKTFPFGAGWGAGPVAPNLVNDWKAAEPNDKRRDATIQDWSEVETFTFGGYEDYVQETGYYAKKFSPITAKNEATKSGYSVSFENVMYPGNWSVAGVENFQLNNIHDLVIIRYADVLLMQAELKKQVTEGWREICKRAGTEAPTSYSLQALQNERRWEFACEGLRWNDIRRWHIAAKALAAQENQPTFHRGKPDTNKAHNGGYSARYKATAGFQKMPASQIAIGTVVQNDGWTSSDSEYGGW